MTQNPPKKDKNLSGWQAPSVFKTSDFFSSTLQATEKQSAEENTQVQHNNQLSVQVIIKQTTAAATQQIDKDKN